MSAIPAAQTLETSADETAVRATVGQYVEGLRTGDVATLQQAFHPQAVMSGYLGDQVMITPIQGLYDFVAASPAPARTGEPFRAEIRSLRIAGGTAAVELAEHSYLGHDFTDHFHLLRVDGRWTIISKIFQTVSHGEAAA